MPTEDQNVMTKKSKQPQENEVPKTFAEATKDEPTLVKEVVDKNAKEIEALKAEIEMAKAEAQANWDKLLRKEAEFQNLQRRSQQELDKARKFGNDRFAEELLAVVDSFEQGLTHEFGPENKEALAMQDGMKLTYKLLMDILNKHEVKEINPEGEAFDPQLHEAISMQETAEIEPNRVVVVVQKGYLLHDRVLRAARVVLSRAPASK